MGSACRSYKEMTTATKIFIGTSEGERSIKVPAHREYNNIKTHLKEVEWEYVDYIHLVHKRNW